MYEQYLTLFIYMHYILMQSLSYEKVSCIQYAHADREYDTPQQSSPVLSEYTVLPALALALVTVHRAPKQTVERVRTDISGIIPEEESSCTICIYSLSWCQRQTAYADAS